MRDTNIAIKVENISKRYRIGLKDDMNDSFLATTIGFIKSPLRNYRKFLEYKEARGDYKNFNPFNYHVFNSGNYDEFGITSFPEFNTNNPHRKKYLVLVEAEYINFSRW